MRLTVEEDREAIKRYRHVRPGGALGSGLCRVACPGTQRSCTRERGHRGPHVAHGRFRRVVAVWDAGHDIVRSAERARPEVRRTPRGEVWTGGFGGAVEAFWRGLRELQPSVGDMALLVLFLAFVVFAIDWLSRIF